MFRALLIAYLTIATAVGPSLCCCSTTSAVSCIRGWFGLSPVTCAGGAACCSQPKTPAAHKHGHTTCHGHSTSPQGEECQHANASADQKSGDQPEKQTPQKRCPCQQDENERSALPSSVAAGKTLQFTGDIERATINWILDLPIDESTTAENCALHSFRTDRLGGREILRALHILRC